MDHKDSKKRAPSRAQDIEMALLKRREDDYRRRLANTQERIRELDMERGAPVQGR